MKMMKRAIALFLSFLMLNSLPVGALAQSSVSGNDVKVETVAHYTKDEVSVTLDFLPAGIIAESESMTDTTAVITANSVTLYKSLDNGAEGIEVAVEAGTVIDLITKYTFTTDTGSLVFYRYDYYGTNEELNDAALSEYSGYVFVYSGDISIQGTNDSGSSGSTDAPVETEKTDTATGVIVSAELPENVTITVTERTIEESGLDTTVYPVNGASLFYDVTLYQDDLEYQPKNGVTVTFPEAAITNSGLAVGDSYNVYHIHDGATEITGPYEYTGGNISVDFDNLSVVGISESTTGIDLTTLFGAFVSEENYYAWATITSDTVNVYGAVDSSSTDTYELTGVSGVDVEVIKKATYENGELYQIAYRGDDTEIQNIFSNVNNYFIPATYLLLTCTCNCDYCTGTSDCACCENCTCGEDAELQPTYESLMETGCLADFEELFESLDEATQTKLQASSYWTEIQQHNYHLVYSHFYSVGTEDEFNAIKAAYPEAWNYIQNDATLKQYNDLHLERIRYVAANPEIKLELSDERILVTYPSYTNAAGLVQVFAATETAALFSNGRMATFGLSGEATSTFESASDALTVDTNNNGIVLKKFVKDDYDPATGTGTIRLEAYATGSKVTSVTTKQLPADIILVLDLSKSMESSMDNVTRQAVTSGTAEQIYQQYGSDVWVKIGEEYKEVTVIGTDGYTGTIYTAYEEKSSGGKGGSNYSAKNLYEYIEENGVLYFKAEDGKYYQVSASRTGSGGSSKYTLSYVNGNGGTVNIVNGVGGNETVNSSTYQLYTLSTGTVYSSYTFSYTDANGQTVTKTYAPTDSVIGGTNPEYYVMKADGTTIQKSEALVNAVTAFANDVATKAKGTDQTLGTTDDVAHNIAIVGFSGSDKGNTGVYIGSTIDTYSDGISDENYQNALQDMSTTTGVENITSSIGALTNQQGTYTYCGTDMAREIFDKKLAQESNRYVKDGETIRTKVIVVFTDGEPNGTDPYDAPIEDTYYLKNTHGATVYTVGILDEGSVTPVPPTTELNKYMHYMSSNYQNAESMDSPGSFTNTQYAVDGSSYYMLASNSNDLYNIFCSIQSSATEGGSSTSLTESAEVRDLISPYFQLPDGATASSIKVYTSEYKYNAINGAYWNTPVEYSATVEVDGKNINVSNFDYSENWVGTETAADGTVTYRGNKLIIEVPFVMEENFLGGDNVITNGSDFAIYDSTTSTEALETVESPIVDANLKPITNVAKDKHIYYTNTTDLTGILDLYIDVEGTEENDLRVVADGVNNAYVDLVYDVTVTLEDGTTATYTYTVPAGKTWEEGVWTRGGTSVDLNNLELANNTEYSVKCTMTSQNNTTKEVETIDTATIYVYKPVLTFKDATKTPNVESVDYASENYVSEAWKRADGTASTKVTMEGTKPALTLSYTPDVNCVNDNGLVISNKDFHVKIVVKIGEMDVTVNTTFNHTDCSPANCGFDKSKGEFMIHIRTGDLKITKTGWNSTDENQSFIFDVIGPDGFKITVTINGNGSVTIKDLLISKYTVIERTDWSWRYTPDSNSKKITLVANGDNTVTFSNNRSWSYWLSGDSYNENQFTVKSKDKEN